MAVKRADTGAPDTADAGGQNASFGDNCEAGIEATSHADTAHRKKHAARMFEWELQVARDTSLHRKDRYAMCVLVQLRDRTNSKSGRAYPSQQWIAEALGIPLRSIGRAIRNLAAHGHLKIIPGRGTRLGNQYEPILQSHPMGDAKIKDTGVPNSPDDLRTPASYETDRNIGHRRPAFRTPASSLSDTGDQLLGHRRPPIHLLESSPDSSTTGEPLLPATRTAVEERKGEYEKELLRAAEILDVPLNEKRRARWRRDLAELAVRGVLFERHLVPAMLAAVLKGLEQGKCPEITSLHYFEQDALQNIDRAAASGPGWTQFAASWWDSIQRIRGHSATPTALPGRRAR